MIGVRRYSAPEVDIREALRYAKCPTPDAQTEKRIRELSLLCEGELDFAVSYTVLDVCINGDVCDMGGLSVLSKSLCEQLSKCKKVIVFAATVGVEIDRLIKKYGAISPAKAVLLQAIGAEPNTT